MSLAAAQDRQSTSPAQMRGSWQKLMDAGNALTNDLVGPMNEMIRVIGAASEGDLSQQVPREIDGLKLQGQFFTSAQIVNTMVSRLGTFSCEVTRVAREVGTEGKLGGQAEVAGVSGTWKDLTDSVNGIAANLTGQVRNIADVTTAVANGEPCGFRRWTWGPAMNDARGLDCSSRVRGGLRGSRCPPPSRCLS